MDRVNVMLDDEARSAAAYLANEMKASVSSAIRYALFQTAKRHGWKPERAKERRQGAARTGEEV